MIGQLVGFTRLVKILFGHAASGCAIREAKIEGGVGALRESDVTNFLKPNGQSRNLNIYGRHLYSSI